MKRNTMIAGSYPTIITSGGNPRVNKDLIDNLFLKKYITILGELLKTKGNLKEIQITYIGGYSKEENNARAKLYLSAYNYYLNALGYESLNKSNLNILDIDNSEETIEKLEQCDLLFLGIGADRKVGAILEALEKNGIQLNQLIETKNLIVSSICSGSVMSAERIFGGTYDTYYYGKEPYDYPINFKSLSINTVTMETDFCPQDASPEKNKNFIENNLKPESYKCVFFACKPNSFCLMSQNKIIAYGEMYLFIDGEVLAVETELEKSDITELVLLVNAYNKIKNRENRVSEQLVESIKRKIQILNKTSIKRQLEVEEQELLNEFTKIEREKKDQRRKQVEEWKENLKSSLNELFSEENLKRFANNLKEQEKFKKLNEKILISYNVDPIKKNREELYLKMNTVSRIKRAYLNFPGFYSDFKKELYNLLGEYLLINDRLIFYILDTCGYLFSNQDLKRILNAIKIENKKRPQQMIDSTEPRRILFRKEIKYERS